MAHWGNLCGETGYPGLELRPLHQRGLRALCLRFCPRPQLTQGIRKVLGVHVLPGSEVSEHRSPAPSLLRDARAYFHAGLRIQALSAYGEALALS